jgi:hypothetical protein
MPQGRIHREAVVGANALALTHQSWPANAPRGHLPAILLALIHPTAWKVFSEIQGIKEPGLN